MPVIIEHTLAVNSHENDGACIKDVTSMLEKHEYCIVSDEDFNCHDLKKSVYSFCDYIVGTRFHSVIFSLSSCVPGIAITYAGNKGQGIMSDIGLKDYSIPIGDVRFNSLVDLFTDVVTNKEQVVDKIKKIT